MSAPKVTLAAFESQEFGVATYLRMAPIAPGAPENGNLNLWLRIQNDEHTPITVSAITVSVAGLHPAAKSFPGLSLAIAAHKTADWQQPDDLNFQLPSAALVIAVTCVGFTDPALIQPTLVVHSSPTPDESYGFWGAVGDLRPGEFWQTDGTGHGNTFQQSYAYDVGVAVNATPSGGLLPGTDGSQNSHYRIWGKPIYAIGTGVVAAFRNNFPTNQTPGQIDAAVAQYDWQGKSPDGNGNFFTITSSAGPFSETVLYAHMQPGTLNPALQSVGAKVTEGDFLGLAGNAGASSGPHLHIHSNKTPAQGDSWTGPGRPMPMRNVRTIPWPTVTSAQASQTVATLAGVALAGRGIPSGKSAFWPADSAPVFLLDTPIKQFAVAGDGQLWVITTADRILTTSDRLPRRGLFLGVNPTGSAKALAVSGQQPFIIGMDDKIRQGLPNGWQLLPGSPACLRLSIDPATGVVWVVHLDGRISSFDIASKSWTEHPGNGRAKDICVVGGVVHVVGLDDRVYRESSGPAPKVWTALPGDQKVLRIAHDAASKRIWALTLDGTKVTSSMGDGSWGEFGGPAGGGTDLAVFGKSPHVVTAPGRLAVSQLGWGWMQLNLVAAG